MITSIVITLMIVIVVVIIGSRLFIYVLQEGKGTSMESSGSNQAGFRFHDSPCMQTIHAEQLLLLASTTEPSARVNARLEQAVADDEQQTAHLKVTG